jgi:hypothetical protein
MEELLSDSQTSPFSKLNEISQWIQNLKFAELSVCDDDCIELLDWLIDGNSSSREYLFGGKKTNWQLILRCQCALDFCKGYVEDRKNFNWQQDPKTIYRWLLIDYWRSGAVHWAFKMYGDPKTEARIRQFHFDRKVSHLFRKGDPSKN